MHTVAVIPQWLKELLEIQKIMLWFSLQIVDIWIVVVAAYSYKLQKCPGYLLKSIKVTSAVQCGIEVNFTF